jgi:hypothetical protein
VVEEGLVDLFIRGVDVALRAQQQKQVIVGVDVEGVDKGSQIVVVGEYDGEDPLVEVLAQESHEVR